jgi:hypothetical protein
MKTIIVSLVALSALSGLSGCAMTPQQAQAWSEGLGQMSNTMAYQQAQYQQPQQRPLYCRSYGSFTKCE